MRDPIIDKIVAFLNKPTPKTEDIDPTLIEKLSHEEVCAELRSLGHDPEMPPALRQRLSAIAARAEPEADPLLAIFCREDEPQTVPSHEEAVDEFTRLGIDYKAAETRLRNRLRWRAPARESWGRKVLAVLVMRTWWTAPVAAACILVSGVAIHTSMELAALRTSQQTLLAKINDLSSKLDFASHTSMELAALRTSQQTLLAKINDLSSKQDFARLTGLSAASPGGRIWPGNQWNFVRFPDAKVAQLKTVRTAELFAALGAKESAAWDDAKGSIAFVSNQDFSWVAADPHKASANLKTCYVPADPYSVTWTNK